MGRGILDIDVDNIWGTEKPKRKRKVSTSIKNEVLVRQKYKCHKCKKPLPATKHFHHKKPVSKGGKDTLSNLIVLCPNCHSQHHHRQQVKKANKKAERGGRQKDSWGFNFDDLI